MAEYQIEELATASGVSARNIRAYRERGLLDAPRRQGRLAYYDDHHLAQLRTIASLLNKGFTSAHIAEFFAGTRDGHDLAEILGLQPAIFGQRRRTSAAVALDADGDVARRLVEHGLAEVVDGQVVIHDAELAAVIADAADPVGYLDIALRTADTIAAPVHEIAAALVGVWERGLASRFGSNYVSRPEHLAELRRVVTDYRAIGGRVVASQLAVELRRRVIDADASYSAAFAVSGQRDP